MTKSESKLAKATVLFIRIPWKRTQRHVVHVKGNFQSAQGVEFHAHNPYDAEISRVRELKLSDTEFRFEDLYLNETGYDFYIWLNNTNYEVIEATPQTYFEVQTREFVAADGASLKPMFDQP